MPIRPPPQRHWRSYATEPLPIRRVPAWGFTALLLTDLLNGAAAAVDQETLRSGQHGAQRS
jgi:hypothetical protein